MPALLACEDSPAVPCLAPRQGNILDDTKLIETLAVSKATSEEIMAAVAEAEIAEKEIDETRAKYIPVSVRGAILFFCIADLSRVDPSTPRARSNRRAAALPPLALGGSDLRRHEPRYSY